MSPRVPRVLSAVALLATTVRVASLLPQQPPTGYETFFEQAAALAPDPSAAVAISNTVLVRDAGVFRFGEGTVFPLTPIGGRTVAAVFVGAGTFHLAPPNRVERGEMRRALGADTLMRPFTALFAIFTDSTLAELTKGAAGSTIAAPAAARDVIAQALEYLSDRDSRSFDTHLAEAILHDNTSGHFYAHFFDRRDQGAFLIYRVDPFDREEIGLLRRGQGRDRGDVTDVVASFARTEPAASSGGEPRPERVNISRYVIESSIASNTEYTAAATMEITVRTSGVRWIPLILYPELTVDSARWDGGSAATAFQGKKSPHVWLDLSRPHESGERRVVTLYYHGWLIDREHGEDWFYLKAPSNWLPRHDGDLLATFDLTFHTPALFDLVSVGDLADSTITRRMRTTHWITPTPITQPGFAIGKFEEYSKQLQTVPGFTIMMSPTAHADLNTRFLTGAGMLQDVAGDVANSLLFFTERFGRLPVRHLYATEIPYLHGQAFNGLIHLSFATFWQKQREVGQDEEFRAHEVAHQWWGVGVEPASYRDHWLSEGFASFSSLWYIDARLFQPKQYREFLEAWRKEIFDRHDRTGPIAVGARCMHEGEGADLDAIIYRKGAWVLHMLRILMQDPVTGNDDRFVATMRDFYETHAGGRASTADFRRTAERHAGQDLGWFFSQWVDGTALPTYRFAWNTGTNPAGEYVIRLRVEQEGVPPEFQMVVPVELEFTDGQTGVVPLTVKGPLTEVSLPPIGLEPRRVTFNPNEAVLAEVKEVSWPAR
jgi:hypothetical protein